MFLLLPLQVNESKICQILTSISQVMSSKRQVNKIKQLDEWKMRSTQAKEAFFTRNYRT